MLAMWKGQPPPSTATHGEAPTSAPLCRTEKRARKSGPEVKRVLHIASLACLLTATAAAAIFCLLLYDADRLLVDSNNIALSLAVSAQRTLQDARATLSTVGGLAIAARSTFTSASAAATEARGLVRDARGQLKSTMPLVNANLIHADLVLSNMERASEHQDEVA